jgi:exocyst complex component 2
VASSKADQVFLPVVENASKAQKLRTTLGFFERSKFFFNLPGTLLDSITAVRAHFPIHLYYLIATWNQGRYDAAMRDYSKGKFMLERPGQLLPIGKEKETKPAPELEAQQKRILDKVWASVERTMGEMKAMLTVQLRDGSKSVEDHEKTLE